MIAIAIREPGPPEVLVPIERPTPEILPGDVLVKVAAAGVNRPDVMQRLGSTRPHRVLLTFPGSKSPAKSPRLAPT